MDQEKLYRIQHIYVLTNLLIFETLNELIHDKQHIKWNITAVIANHRTCLPNEQISYIANGRHHVRISFGVNDTVALP
jgi:hypothetical protein